MKYDTTMKNLLRSGAPALVRQLTGSTVARIDLTEYPATRNRHPDFIAHLRDGRLLHMELQGDPDQRMDWRLLEYYGPISESNDGRPVVQIVLALNDRAAAIPNEIVHPNLRFRFEVISFGQLDAEPLLNSDLPADTLLAILCRTDDMRNRVRVILRRLRDLDENERKDAIAQLLVLAGLRKAEWLVQEEAKTMGYQIDLEQNQVLKTYFERAEARGKAEGKAELLLRQLERRFGPLPNTVSQKVRTAEPEDLDRLAEAILDATSLETLVPPPARN